MYTMDIPNYQYNLAQSCIQLANDHETHTGKRPVRFMAHPTTLRVENHGEAWRDEGIYFGGIRVISSPLCPVDTIYAISDDQLEAMLVALERQYAQMMNIGDNEQ